MEILDQNGMLYIDKDRFAKVPDPSFGTFGAHDRYQIIRVDFPDRKSVMILIDEKEKKVIAIAKRGSIKYALPNGIWHPLGDNISLCPYTFYDILEIPEEREKIVKALKEYLGMDSKNA